MKKLMKMMMSVLAICVIAAAHCAAALAAVGNLPDSFLIADEDGISVNNEGEYFLHSSNLLPGDVITRTLTLRNLELGEPFRLHMLGESPTSSGTVDWLDNLHLQITLDGREVYAGRLRGDGADTRTMQGNGVNLVTDGLDLGVFEKGDYGVLVFTVTADAGHMSTRDLTESSTANIGWSFSATRDTKVEPTDPVNPMKPEPQSITPNPVAPKPDAPKTGDVVRGGIYILIISLGVLCVVFYHRYRKLRRA